MTLQPLDTDFDMEMAASGHAGDDPRYSALVQQVKYWRRRCRQAEERLAHLRSKETRQSIRFAINQLGYCPKADGGMCSECREAIAALRGLLLPDGGENE